ncbi:leucine--tRNA ligase [Roseomonas sp. CECT 9278]|uniref:leucine--tRNA ligase n=1 Tax=Roseomonas sp. CECT 9278 TaxID=2845823 RepID=UPI001E5A6F8B|nr:leucine--tRNA ligase [Roseomonas sp. CECT 9278]CAH0127472.1 Leucine--tRNA ligase [Roseomonas sp. CECT 9278]
MSLKAERTGYDFTAIEERWRRIWREQKTYKTPDPEPGQRTFYVLDMFPFPSGYGLHVGHPVGYLATDIVARYRRASGDLVLHPMGWDSFGLPAEQHAIRTGEHPRDAIGRNIENYRRQMELIGLSYDWDREITTSEPEYYHWTQFLFLKLYDAWFDESAQRARSIDELPIPDEISDLGQSAIAKFRDSKRLVYFASAPVNYCPELGTVLANEEVYDGRTEQGYEVIRINLPQVIMRISSFAERLLAGLEGLDWPEGIKETQRNWIGRSEGVELDFDVEGHDRPITVYTTRAETLAGVTFLAVAPEVKDVNRFVTDEHREKVAAYIGASARRSDLSRTTSREKTGEFTGSYAINPLTGRRSPIFVADYVLADHGTGAVMGVPAHDERDWEFAHLYGIEVIPVVRPTDPTIPVSIKAAAFVDAGAMIAEAPGPHNKAYREGQPSGEARSSLTSYAIHNGFGRRSVRYNIRDWIFARQRYWGEPIPVIHWEDGETTALNYGDLPLLLPHVEDFKPAGGGKSALGRAVDWINVVDPATGRRGVRETATMPNWAGSCWYPLRFTDPHNEKGFASWEMMQAWGPVDLYIGGAEHATLHLLYSRFWYLALYDLGLIPYAEPFKKLVNQGMLVSFAYKNARGVVIAVDEVIEAEDGRFVHQSSGELVERITTKMSKSLRNVVTPDEVIARFGSDAFRMFLMFMGPVEGPRVWETDKVASTARLLKRIWSFSVSAEDETQPREWCAREEQPRKVTRALVTLVKEVSSDLENIRLNTCVSEIMKFMNVVEHLPISKEAHREFLVVLNPFAPFLAEELWSILGEKSSVNKAAWPAVSANAEMDDTVNVVLQVSGRKRVEVEVDANADDERLHSIAVALAKPWLEATAGVKVIIVRDKATGRPKLVNVVRGAA